MQYIGVYPKKFHIFLRDYLEVQEALFNADPPISSLTAWEARDMVGVFRNDTVGLIY